MTEYEYHMLCIGLKEGNKYPVANYHKAARYAARRDRANVSMWKKLEAERLEGVRHQAKRQI